MLRAARGLAIIVGCYGLFVVAMQMIFPLPARPQPPDPVFVTAESALQTTLAPLVASHPGTSGIVMLDSGSDAFAARIHLAREATVSIDAQYYIWHDDLTGIRLLSQLQEAARRGVHVRLLVDDNGTPALDQELAALDALPTAQVRIFNPFTLRSWRPLNYAFDFFRLNRRMHNKSFTVDGIVTIVGGRNIGDVYFETGGSQTYVDRDVIAVGPAAADVSADFARYWESLSAYPASGLITLDPASANRLEGRDEALRDTEQGRNYAAYVHDSSFVADLLNVTLRLEWVPTRLFSDDPDKVLGLDDDDDLMIRRLFAEIGTPEHSLDLISAYFIPGTSAAQQLAGFVVQGARVRVLTNSLEATDVVAVHGAYAHYRRQLIEDGVEVYELRSQGSDKRTVREVEFLGQSSATVHAKSFSVDRRRAFIGSLNFDPRSRRLNTEMGLLIDSPLIAGDLSHWLDENLAGFAYHVGITADGKMEWSALDQAGQPVRFDAEPNTSIPLRLLVGLIGLLPVQWLL
ncbi:MAG: phospholipase D family protein [Rhodobacteraceae bacterium]|nr:phospholipase D family protein [Paracoccaceae bacterium]MCF8513038.1 phospholipase D family protein [Paracoccaceae bacterium]MCF8517283.1 phospholipase D family protein [Paracoccaceae bacterium]